MKDMGFEFRDISGQVYGKYQYCTMRGDMWYADQDFEDGFGGGRLKPGALPSPHQDTPDLCARAKAMHEAAAKAMVERALNPLAPDPLAPEPDDPPLWHPMGLFSCAIIALLGLIVLWIISH